MFFMKFSFFNLPIINVIEPNFITQRQQSFTYKEHRDSYLGGII